MTIIGIKPMFGVAISTNGHTWVFPLKDISKMKLEYPDMIVFLEKVSVKPEKYEGKVKDFMQKAVNSYEELKVWLKDHQIPYVLVHPVAWEAKLGLRAQESHKERKARLWNKAKELFPRIKIQSWNVTPLLLTTFGEYMIENELDWILSNLPKDIKIAERE